MANSDSTPSLIAHSFGTYIVGAALEQFAEIRFDRIVLCGSIVRRDYNWGALIESGRVDAVLNDYGGKDLWPKVAEFLISDGGASGTKGFSIPHANLYQRYRPVFSHSDYFYPLNYRENWIPFLEGGEPATVPVERARVELALATDARGWIHRELGEVVDAEKDFVHALALLDSLLAESPTGPRFREAVALVCNSLALIEQATGRLSDAEAHLRHELPMVERLSTDFTDRPEYVRQLARTLMNLGNVLSDQGRGSSAPRPDPGSYPRRTSAGGSFPKPGRLCPSRDRELAPAQPLSPFRTPGTVPAVLSRNGVENRRNP